MKGFETERTILRMFTMDDLDAVAAICSNPRVTRYMGINGTPISREEAKAALISILKHWEKNSFGRWAVVDKESNKLIGYAGIRSYDGTAELVYLLDEPFWNKGLATEISNAVINVGFEIYNFPLIIAITRPENKASIRVMEKIGMTFDKNDLVYEISAVIYELSKEDYQAQQQQQRVIPNQMNSTARAGGSVSL